MRDYIDVNKKRDIFVAITEKYKGEFHKKITSSGYINIMEVQIPYNNQLIFLTESDSRPLKIEVLFKRKLGFEFTISLEDFVTNISKMLGKKEVITDYQIFDKTYLIESTDFLLCKKLLSRELMDLILKNHLYSISLQDVTEEEKSIFIMVKSHTEDKLESYIDFVEVAMMMVDDLN